MALATNTLRMLAAGYTTLGGLAVATGAGRKELAKAIQVLKRRGLVETHSIIGGEVSGPAPGSYRLTEAGEAFAESGREVAPGQGERPRKRTAGLRERAWWHFRAHKVASLRDLISTHAEGSEKDPHVNLYKYLRSLERVGILDRLPNRVKARQSKGLVLWRLARDIGPKAPVWRESARTVYDPNTNAVHAIPQEAADEQGA